MWTAFAIFQAIAKAPSKIEVEKKILDPITPSIDQATVDLLTNRQQIDLTLVPSPVPVEINVIESVESVASDASSEATTSGTIETGEVR
jgi:hypothetical protein